MGTMANDILSMVGQDFLFAHKDILAEVVRRGYKEEIEKLFNPFLSA